MSNTIPDSFLDKLERRAEQLKKKLSEMWSGDPTVLSSFQADFDALLTQVEQGELRVLAAGAALTKLYQNHFPVAVPGVVNHRNIPAPGARSVPGHGQFYKLDSPGVYGAIDYADSPAYQNAKPDRRIWLTYTNSRARQLI